MCLMNMISGIDSLCSVAKEYSLGTKEPSLLFALFDIFNTFANKVLWFFWSQPVTNDVHVLVDV